GSFRTDGSAHILAFTQEGDDFLWSTPPALDVSENAPSASAQLKALTVPPDVRVHALINVAVNFPDGVDYLYISSPDTVDVAAAGSATPLNNFTSLTLSGGAAPGGQLRVRTNASRQIRYRFSHTSGTNNVKISTLGWIDSRGRNL
ncbi:MAG: hypothetical protein JSR47_15950, partial [Proteobacteria bacterium]|nr:hypothetical protein [Pseudomonadota bacterium]